MILCSKATLLGWTDLTTGRLGPSFLECKWLRIVWSETFTPAVVRNSCVNVRALSVRLLRVFNRFNATNSVCDSASSGGTRVTKQSQDKFIRTLSLSNRTLNARTLTHELRTTAGVNVSDQTIRNILNRQLNELKLFARAKLRYQTKQTHPQVKFVMSLLFLFKPVRTEYLSKPNRLCSPIGVRFTLVSLY
jgi:hypothetical protein